MEFNVAGRGISTHWIEVTVTDGNTKITQDVFEKDIPKFAEELMDITLEILPDVSAILDHLMRNGYEQEIKDFIETQETAA